MREFFEELPQEITNYSAELVNYSSTRCGMFRMKFFIYSVVYSEVFYFYSLFIQIKNRKIVKELLLKV